MPWEPPVFRTVEERIEHNARCLQLHDPDEIRARYWHTNMRIRRVVISFAYVVLIVFAYFLTPVIVNRLLNQLN